MPDRASENTKKDWRIFLRRATHITGVKENYVDPFQASQRQTEPVVNLNDPKNKTRQTRLGTQTDQPFRGGRPEPLKNTAETKNSPLI